MGLRAVGSEGAGRPAVLTGESTVPGSCPTYSHDSRAAFWWAERGAGSKEECHLLYRGPTFEPVH